MSKAFVAYNAEHFQQPRRSGATVADRGDFCNGLQEYQTTNEDLKNNTFDVLGGEFEESNINESEVPFYDSIKCDPQQITTISEEIPFNDFKR